MTPPRCPSQLAQTISVRRPSVSCSRRTDWPTALLNAGQPHLESNLLDELQTTEDWKWTRLSTVPSLTDKALLHSQHIYRCRFHNVYCIRLCPDTRCPSIAKSDTAHWSISFSTQHQIVSSKFDRMNETWRSEEKQTKWIISPINIFWKCVIHIADRLLPVDLPQTLRTRVMKKFQRNIAEEKRLNNP